MYVPLTRSLELVWRVCSPPRNASEEMARDNSQVKSQHEMTEARRLVVNGTSMPHFQLSHFQRLRTARCSTVRCGAAPRGVQCNCEWSMMTCRVHGEWSMTRPGSRSRKTFEPKRAEFQLSPSCKMFERAENERRLILHYIKFVHVIMRRRQRTYGDLCIKRDFCDCEHSVVEQAYTKVLIG